MALDFRFILIIKLIKRFTFAVNQANFKINLGIERVLIDYKNYLSRATDGDGIVVQKELVDDNDQIYVY